MNVGIPLSSSLKNFHNELANEIPFNNIKTTDDFGYNYGFTVGMRFGGNTSFFFSNRVSGAKSSVADYSGHLRLTNELNGYTFGLEYEILLKEFSKGILNMGVKGLVTKSDLILKTQSRILNQFNEDNMDFKSFDFGTAIGLNYEYSLKFIIFRAHLDLDIYLGGKLRLKENGSDDLYVTDDNGNKVTTGRTGFTSGLGFLIPLAR